MRSQTLATLDKKAVNDRTSIEISLGSESMSLSFIEYPFKDNKADLVIPESVSGILGIEALKKHSVIIDYPRRKLILMKGDIFPAGYSRIKWQKMTFSYDKYGALILFGDANNNTFCFLVDTGSSYSTIAPNKVPQSLPKLPCPANLAPEDKFCSIVIIPKLKIEGISTQDQSFYIHNSKYKYVDGYLGTNFFNEHIVYINFRKKFFYISKVALGKLD